jgi:hypothetical protein
MDGFARLRLTGRALAARIGAWALVAHRPLPEVLSALTPRAVRRAPRDLAEDAARASERLARRLRVVPDTCLYRALARYAVLRHAGHPARFVMGLDPAAAQIEGHAWVELDGEPVGETLAPGLKVTFSFPSQP